MSTAPQTVEPALLVAGRLVHDVDYGDVINPATGEPFARYPIATAALAEEALSAARAALPAWAADAPRRQEVLRQIAAVLHERSEELAATLSGEIGIPLRDARLEVKMASAMLMHRAEAELPVDVVHDDERQSVRVVRDPVGVVAAIIPWNAPLLIACEKMGSAFAAGDTCVIKPSSMAPLTLVRLGTLVRDIVPEGVLSVLSGGNELGAVLTSHPDVAMVSFTGSVATGKRIMEAAVPTLKRLSLELGGNDAAIVMPGADIARLAPKIFQGAFYRSGQICAAVKRVYVHERDEQRLLDAFGALADAAVLGDPFDEHVTMGPLSNRPQLQEVSGMVQDALDTGGRAVSGGAALDRPGFFYPPTVVTAVDADTKIVKDEQFGPALPVVPYETLDGAVAAANGTEFGLGSSVWGDDVQAAAEVAAQMQAGSAWVNRHGLVMPEVPFGGFKYSGIGRSNGAVGIDAYCELKTISVAKPRG